MSQGSWFSPAAPLPQAKESLVAKRPFLHFSTSSTPGRLGPSTVLCLKPSRTTAHQPILEASKSETQHQSSGERVQVGTMQDEPSGKMQQKKQPSSDITSSPVSGPAQCFLSSLKPIRTSAAASVVVKSPLEAPQTLETPPAAGGDMEAPVAPTTLPRNQQPLIPQRAACSDTTPLSPLSLLFATTPTFQEAQDFATMCLASPSFQLPPLLSSPSQNRKSHASESYPELILPGHAGKTQDMSSHYQLASTSAPAHLDSDEASIGKTVGRLNMPQNIGGPRQRSDAHRMAEGRRRLSSQRLETQRNQSDETDSPIHFLNRILGENNCLPDYPSLLPPPAPLSLPPISSSIMLQNQSLPQQQVMPWQGNLNTSGGDSLGFISNEGLDQSIRDHVTKRRPRAKVSAGNRKRDRGECSRFARPANAISGKNDRSGLSEENLTETETEDEGLPTRKPRTNKIQTGKSTTGLNGEK